MCTKCIHKAQKVYKCIKFVHIKAVITLNFRIKIEKKIKIQNVSNEICSRKMLLSKHVMLFALPQQL